MSQFDQPYSDPSMSGEQGEYSMPRTSGLAVTSLVCSLICCLPITTIPGIIFGGLALGAMSKNPNLTGRGMAIAGIVLGIIFTIAQIGILSVGYRAYVEWRDTPAVILEPGFAGDYAGLRDNFGTYGQHVTDDEAREFIEELRGRYGELLRSEIDLDAYQGFRGPEAGATEMTFLAVLVFEHERVDIEYTVDFLDAGRHDHQVVASMRIIDPGREDIVFPPPKEADQEQPEVPGEGDQVNDVADPDNDRP